jgi:hypothetical protein
MVILTLKESGTAGNKKVPNSNTFTINDLYFIKYKIKDIFILLL